jgi:hypothetical protein
LGIFDYSEDGDNEGEMKQENCPLQYSGFDNGRRGRGREMRITPTSPQFGDSLRVEDYW